MTREHKVALMVGFALVLVVGILVADHFSKASLARVNADLASGTPHEYGRYAAADPAMPSPIPSTQPEDPLLADAGELGTSRAEEKPPVFDIVMGASRPELEADPIDSFASTGAAIRNGIEQLGLDQSPAALRLDRPIVSREADPVPAAWPQAERAAPPEAPLPVATAPELPVSRSTVGRHEVVAGDNLTKIAAKHYGDKSLWRQLQTYNAGRVGKDGVIRVGVTLMIPPKEVLLGRARLASESERSATAVRAAAAEPKVRPAGAKPAPEKASKPAPAKPAPRTYTVKPGDTLLKIAQRQLGTTRRWTEIRDLNKSRINDLDTIHVGLVLAMPTE